MKLLLLAILGMIIVAPIVLDNAFGAVVYENICNTLKEIPSKSWKLFLCSTVEINEDALGITLDNTDHFGDSVANIGDLDGDGVNDLAVGAKRDDGGSTDAGSLYILFMNKDGSVKELKKIEDDNITDNGPELARKDRFGDSVVNIGDLNGDGIDDLAVGAPNDDTKSNGQGFAEHGDNNWDAGAVYILFMNRDGSLAEETVVIDASTRDPDYGPALAKGDAFGMGVANIGDLDGNGYDDLAVGAMMDDGISSTGNRGAVYILFMDENGGLAKETEIIDDSTENGPTLGNGYWFGGSVANIGDFDGNGVNDLAVGANRSPGGGSVATGAVYILFMDEDPGNGLAKETVVIDDTNTDGLTLASQDRFGASVVNMGDIDDDGVNDLAAGARLSDVGGTWTGIVYILFMNADGSVDSTIEINNSTDKGPTLSAGEAFGTSLAHIGDLNGDGVNDLVVGANEDDGGGTDRGIVYILFFTSEVKKSGSGCPDCIPPSISKRGLAEIPDGFKINDEIISVKKYTNNPTQPYEVNVGDPVTFSLRAYENSGPVNIIFSALYMDMHGKSISRYDSSAYVRYHMDKQSFEVVDKDKIFSAVGVTNEVTKPYPNSPNQEMMDITFTIIFAKPMETSHIVMELWDDKRNPSWINILDAIKVSEIPVVEEPIPEVPKEPEVQIEQEPIPEAPLEPEPDPLPDEEIILTEEEPEKSILSFVDTEKEPNHYVKRYVTETEYQEWFDTNYPDYTIWEGIGITQYEYNAIADKIESEPKLILISEPHYYMEAEKEPQTFELEETHEHKQSPRKQVQEKNDLWSWFFSIFS